MRRKPVPCAMGCGRDTRSDNGVCPDCLHTYHLGQDAERVEAETSNKALEYIEMPYTLRLWWAERPSDDKHRDLAKKAETDIRRLILAIAGAGRANTYDINNKPVLVNRRQYDYSGGRDTLSVPAGKAQMIADLVDAISLFVTCESMRAHNEADNVLMRLASGDVSVTEYNDYTARHAGRKRDL